MQEPSLLAQVIESFSSFSREGVNPTRLHSLPKLNIVERCRCGDNLIAILASTFGGGHLTLVGVLDPAHLLREKDGKMTNQWRAVSLLLLLGSILTLAAVWNLSENGRAQGR